MQWLSSLADRSDFDHQLGFEFIILDDPAPRLRTINAASWDKAANRRRAWE
jgi:hypothetical protein